MATTTTLRSPSPAMGGSLKSGHRRTSSTKTSRPAPESRGVSKSKSDESLDLMQAVRPPRIKTSSDSSNHASGNNNNNSTNNASMTNRQRIANLAAKLNDSASSIKSGSEELKDTSFSKRDRKRNPPRPVRRRRSKSPSIDNDNNNSKNINDDDDDGDDSTIASTASNKPSSGRSTRESRTTGRSSSRRRGSSRSRSKSRHRSKSAKSRPRRRNPPSRTPSGDSRLKELMGGERDFNSSSCFIPPISPVVGQSNGHGTAVRSPPNSGDSDASKLSLSEMELLNFLGGSEALTPTNSERMARSVPVVDLEYSGRASRTTGGNARRAAGGSTRRERTVGSTSRSSKERSASTRDRSDSTATTNSNSAVVTSSSSYKRPPRTSRGVGRSQSASVASIHGRSGSTNVDALLSPRKTIPRTPTSRSGSGSSGSSKDAGGEPTRGVRRAKSTDDMGDLTSYLSQTTPVSRRKKAGSGNKSVASMPTGNRRNSRKLSDYYDPMSKPPSSKSTVTASETYDSEYEEDESIDESLEELNDMKSYPSSSRSMESATDADDAPSSYSQQQHQSLSNLNMEAALQMHMSRTENLLYDVFPKHIAEALRSGRKVEPENHECVTIFFSDIVGFTQISSELDPMKISDLLDRLYNSFDALSHYHDVFKVETIGDAYMAVTNLTKKQPDHCKRIAEFAIDAIRVANQTLVDKEDPTKGFINIRVGFHSGPVVSNVVGSRNPRFCLFGDTVNTASRMESNSFQNRIHCSDSSASLLREQHPNLRLNPRGTIEVKGKGEMETFWVNEDAAVQSQREGTSRSIFKMLQKKARNGNRRGSVV